MSITVCSGYHPAAFKQYAADFLLRFDQYWPERARLVVYVEELLGLGALEWEHTVIERSLDRCVGVRRFIERHKDIARHCGRAPHALWKERERADGYSFRFDAVKFCKQLFIPENAAQELPDGDILCWVDADVMTFDKFDISMFEYLLDGADICFLGREPKHSEIGFWAVRLNERTREFLTALAEKYRTDEVFLLPEWHSAYVFDHVRKLSRMKQRDLTPGGRGHVWFQSPLGAFSDHCKGDRKGRGSKECPVKWWENP